MTFKSTQTEDLTDQVDGVVDTFSIANGPYLAGTLVVHHNGDRLRSGVGFDFEENGTQDGFTLCFAPRNGDTVQAQYEIEEIGTGFPFVVASGIDC